MKIQVIDKLSATTDKFSKLFTSSLCSVNGAQKAERARSWRSFRIL